MPTDTQPTLKEITTDRWESLPEDLRYALLRPDFDPNIKAISTYYKLDERTTQILVNEILLVFFLFEPLSKLASALTKAAPSISIDDASAIVSELKLSIFYGVTDTLSNIEISKEFKGLRSTSTAQIPSASVVAPPPTPPQIPDAPKDLREKLELRPEGILSQNVTASEGGVRPLTREEVLRSLAPARTMAGDIASLSTPPVPETPLVPPKQPE